MDRQGIIKLENSGRDYALQRLGSYARDLQWNHYRQRLGCVITTGWCRFQQIQRSLKLLIFSGKLFSPRTQPGFHPQGKRKPSRSRSLCPAEGTTLLKCRLQASTAMCVCTRPTPLIRKSQTTGSLVVELQPGLTSSGYLLPEGPPHA